jgi:pimeloyl-ACP methyl ester carboxylesterase
MKTLILTFLTFAVVVPALAQTKSFNTTITFASESRTLSGYVPENYDSTQSYALMICLHGLGDNSNNYRNALINSLNWPALFPNTIFICPDGGSDANKDFYSPAGDQEIITASIDYAKAHFTIDTTAILLQGFSLGGRSALKFGLEHPDRFKGLLLNTPALQGLMDEQNNPNASLVYNYDQAAHIPLFITVGETDYTYQYQIGALIQTLKRHNAPVQFEQVAQLGHSIPGASITQKASDFLVHHMVPDTDADVFAMSDTIHFCSSQIETSCLVRNNGDSVIHSLDINIQVGNTSVNQQWTGTLLPNHFASIPLSIAAATEGTASMAVTLSTVNGQVDSIPTNNSLAQEIAIASSENPASVVQTFDDPSHPWFIHSSGSLFGWSLDDQVKHSGTQSISTFNTALLFYTKEAVESFSSPFISVSGLAKKELNFDVAFAYFNYTPPYVTTETDFADTLEILISTDCGATYTSLYKKGGKELATKAEPIVNALSIQSISFIPTEDEWRTETIDLSAYATAEHAIFRFNCISGMGGILNIDNISLGAAYVGLSEKTAPSMNIKIYPNPAADHLTIESPSGSVGNARLYNSHGQLVAEQSGTNGPLIVQTGDLPNGIYFVHVQLDGQTSVQKLMVNH